ncbi:MAG: serine/threonine-protein kinase [Cystobacter sp.]
MGNGESRNSRFSIRTVRDQALDTSLPQREQPDVEAPPVSQVGRYLLLKPLGQGGMGVVYSAYDPDLDRKVALKLLQSDGGTGSGTARARLLREARAMARVTHPHVVPIYDVGTWGDYVFLAMEMAGEGTLSSWLRKERPWREVLEHFLAAGRGLLAAHEAGLVHRDFKPSNVLRGRGGRVYVTDFGLARTMGESLREDSLPGRIGATADRRMLETTLTGEGVVLGTPNYMSPEQYEEGELDARSDQFSFCVALYWGLYRQRAFETERMRAFIQARRKVTQQAQAPARHTLELTPSYGIKKESTPWDVIQEPPRDTKVPTWVRQALMRGMSLEPKDRFPSMRELLDALSQERRRARRQKWALGAGAVGVGVTLLGATMYHQSQMCTGADTLMAEVWRPERGTELEQAFLATGRPGAGEMAARVIQVLGDYATEWKRQSTEACEATRVSGIQTEELMSRRVVCLDRRRQDMRAVVDVLVQADAKLVDQSLEAAYALPALSECADVESLSEQQRLPSDASLRADIARLGGELAGVRALLDAGRYQQALEKGFSLEAPVLATGFLPLAAELRADLGMAQFYLYKEGEAERLLLQALYDAESGRADRLKVFIVNRLLFVENARRHFSQAEGWAGLGEAALRRLGGDTELEADLLTNRANLARSQKHYEEAQGLLEKAYALQERTLPPSHPKLARTLWLLGYVMQDMNDYPWALALLQKALEQTRAALGPMHPEMASRHALLAELLRKMGKPEQALEHARAMVTVREATFGKNSSQVAHALDHVGESLMAAGRPGQALVVFERALSLKRQFLKANDELLHYSYDGVGQSLLRLGRPHDAIPPLRQALSFTSVKRDALAEAGFSLARALAETRAYDEARAEAQQARERFRAEDLTARMADVDAWLASLPNEEQPSGRRLHRAARR